MRFSSSKFVFAAAVTVFLLRGHWAAADNLPGWSGGAAVDQPQVKQPPQQPLVSEPPPAPASTIQAPKSTTLSPHSTTSGPPATSPDWSTPTQPQPAPSPNTRFQTAPSPVLPQTGGRAVGAAPPVQNTASQPPPTGTSNQNATAKKARFRVTLNGFKVFAQKGILPRRGHSYYIAAKVLKYSNWGAILSHETKVTKVMGHTNKFPGAIKGGTATNNGGFRNGDTYPGSVPYAASGAYNDRLPLLVWEGILEERGDVLVVEPTIWEKRNGQDVFRIWKEQFPSQITKLLSCTPNEFLPGLSGYTVPGWTSQNPAPIDKLISLTPRLAGERVCVNITPRDIIRPLGRNEPDTIPGYTEKIFPERPAMTDPHGFLLNYSKANSIASESQTEPVVLVTYSQPSGEFGDPGGFPQGFVRANQRDSNVIPVGGLQPFWFGSQGKSDSLYGPRISISTEPVSDVANFYSAGIANPIVPDSTAIELYLKIQQLSL